MSRTGPFGTILGCAFFYPSTRSSAPCARVECFVDQLVSPSPHAVRPARFPPPVRPCTSRTAVKEAVIGRPADVPRSYTLLASFSLPGSTCRRPVHSLAQFCGRVAAIWATRSRGLDGPTRITRRAVALTMNRLLPRLYPQPVHVFRQVCGLARAKKWDRSALDETEARAHRQAPARRQRALHGPLGGTQGLRGSWFAICALC